MKRYLIIVISVIFIMPCINGQNSMCEFDELELIYKGDDDEVIPIEFQNPNDTIIIVIEECTQSIELIGSPDILGVNADCGSLPALYEWTDITDINDPNPPPNTKSITLNISQNKLYKKIKLTVLAESPDTCADEDLIYCEFIFNVTLNKPLPEIEYEYEYAEEGEGEDENSLIVCSKNNKIIVQDIDTSQYTIAWTNKNDALLSDSTCVELQQTDFENTNDSLFLEITSIDNICKYADAFKVNFIKPPIPDINIAIDVVHPEKCNENGKITFTNIGSKTVYYNFMNSTKALRSDPTTFDMVSPGEYSAEFFFQDDENICSYDTLLTIEERDPVKPVIEISKTKVCVGDTVEIKFTNDSIIDKDEGLFWYFRSKPDNYFERDSDKDRKTIIYKKFDEVGINEMAIRYTDVHNCDFINSDTTFTIEVNSPNAKFYSVPSTLCEGQPLVLSLTEESYSTYEWFLGASPVENSSFTLSIDTLQPDDYTYSVTVTDSIGCVDSIGAEVRVSSGIVELVNILESNIDICYGTQLLYAYNNSLTSDLNDNPIKDEFQFDNNGMVYHLLEWKDSRGMIKDSDKSGECTSAKIDTLNKSVVAPQGEIVRFGNDGPNTLVYSDADNSAQNATYKWFTIDANGFKELKDSVERIADERIIDCGDFECNVDNPNQVIGLLVRDNKTECHNVFLYNAGNLLSADTSVSINENLVNTYFNLYPSPNQGYFNISFSSPILKGTLQFYNVKGQQIHTQKIEYPANHSFNLSNASPGVYYVVLKNNQSVITQQKFIMY